MNKSYYFFVSFLLGLYVLMACFQNLIYLNIGTRTYHLFSFFSWFALTGVIDILAAVIIQRYYYEQKFRLPFLAGILAAAVSLCYYIIIYEMQNFRELEKFYMPTIYIGLIAGILYGLSLIFSKASERPWLKAAGVLLTIGGLIFVSTMTLNEFSQDFRLKIALQNVNQVTSWAMVLVSVFFILNFLSELNQQKTRTSLETSSNFVMAFVAVSVLVSAVSLGIKLMEESVVITLSEKASAKANGIAQLFEARIFVSSRGDTVRYRMMKPQDYDPAKKYPLVVCLHHGGAHGNDNIRQVESSEAPWLAGYFNKRKYPAFLFVPQCPKGLSWMDPATSLAIFEAMQALESEFTIDVKRRYVMGISGGGYGSWHFISAHPEMFAAAIPICGGANPALAKNLVNVGIWAFHGELDELAPVSGSRDMIAAIKKAGGKPRYNEFPDAGHDIWRKVHLTPGLLDWLFAQKKN